LVSVVRQRRRGLVRRTGTPSFGLANEYRWYDGAGSDNDSGAQQGAPAHKSNWIHCPSNLPQPPPSIY
jgi:hypothetical protein